MQRFSSYEVGPYALGQVYKQVIWKHTAQETALHSPVLLNHVEWDSATGSDVQQLVPKDCSAPGPYTLSVIGELLGGTNDHHYDTYSEVDGANALSPISTWCNAVENDDKYLSREELLNTKLFAYVGPPKDSLTKHLWGNVHANLMKIFDLNTTPSQRYSQSLWSEDGFLRFEHDNFVVNDTKIHCISPDEPNDKSSWQGPENMISPGKVEKAMSIWNDVMSDPSISVNGLPISTLDGWPMHPNVLPRVMHGALVSVKFDIIDKSADDAPQRAFEGILREITWLRPKFYDENEEILNECQNWSIRGKTSRDIVEEVTSPKGGYKSKSLLTSGTT